MSTSPSSKMMRPLITTGTKNAILSLILVLIKERVRWRQQSNTSLTILNLVFPPHLCSQVNDLFERDEGKRCDEIHFRFFPSLQAIAALPLQMASMIFPKSVEAESGVPCLMNWMSEPVYDRFFSLLGAMRFWMLKVVSTSPAIHPRDRELHMNTRPLFIKSILTSAQPP